MASIKVVPFFLASITFFVPIDYAPSCSGGLGHPQLPEAVCVDPSDRVPALTLTPMRLDSTKVPVLPWYDNRARGPRAESRSTGTSEGCCRGHAGPRRVPSTTGSGAPRERSTRMSSQAVRRLALVAMLGDRKSTRL